MGLVRTFIMKFNRAIPEVEKPKQRPTLKERFLWTSVVLLVYYFLTQVPIYGAPTGGFDALAQLRVLLAGAAGSIVELGIGPIVTAGIVLELLVGSKIIQLDLTDPNERIFYQSAQRVAAIFFILFETTAYAVGRFAATTPEQTALIVLQLSLGSFLLMMLDDLVSKWGIGSGISLFILAGVAQNVFWGMFSPFTAETGQVVGAIPALFIEGAAAIYRGPLPDLVGVIATFVVFIAVVWAYEVRVNVAIAHTLYGGMRTRYPIRLLYVSNVPIIFASALLGNIRMISTILWMRLSENQEWWAQWLLTIFGRYESSGGGQPIPVSGLAYYLSPPGGPEVLVHDPLRALAYLIFMVLASVLFAKIWVITAGMDPKTVSENLVKQGIVLPGRRASAKVVARTIEKYIEAVTILGGMLVGLLAALADFSGALGTGSGILLAVTIVAGFFEMLMRERALEMYPRLKKFVG